MSVTRETVNLATVVTLMRVAGVSQSAFARTMGMVPGSVAAKVGGRIRFSADEIATLAKMCGVPIEQFFRDVTIDVRANDASNIGVDIPGYHNQVLSPGVVPIKRVA
jgi:hypothetical protein